MATQAPGGLDFETLRQAIEGRDAETLLDFYAEDAEMLTINRNTTPVPLEYSGARSRSAST